MTSSLTRGTLTVTRSFMSLSPYRGVLPCRERLPVSPSPYRRSRGLPPAERFTSSGTRIPSPHLTRRSLVWVTCLIGTRTPSPHADPPTSPICGSATALSPSECGDPSHTTAKHRSGQAPLPVRRDLSRATAPTGSGNGLLLRTRTEDLSDSACDTRVEAPAPSPGRRPSELSG